MSERNVTPGPFKVSPRLIVGIILLALAGFLLFNAIYIVDQTEESVVLTFGKYSRTEGPGMRFKIPFVEENFNVPTKVVQKMDFGFRQDGQDFFSNLTGGGDGSKDAGTTANYKDESRMLTGDLNIIDITWIVQYRILEPRQWLFNLDAKEKTIRDISQSVVSQLVGDRAILDVLGNERQSIETKSLEMINELFRSYGIGVVVTGVQLKDIFPPEGTVKAAFDDVNVAFQDMNRLINEGRETYNKEIPRAAGEAQQQIQVAEGYATERVNNAEGDVARFKAVYGEYRKSPEVTRSRLYMEMMEDIFKSAGGNIDLIDKRLGNFIPLKNLTNKNAVISQQVVPTAQGQNSSATPAQPQNAPSVGGQQ